MIGGIKDKIKVLDDEINALQKNLLNAIQADSVNN